MKVKRITLGYSVLSDYLECPTKFQLGKLQRLAKSYGQDNTRGSPLTFGTLWHLFQERYHSGIAFETAYNEVLQAGAQDPIAGVYPESQRSLEHLRLLMQNYRYIFPDPQSDFKPYAGLEGKPAFEFETSFQLSANPDIIWRQRYDGIVQLPDNSIAILEHKTSSGDLRKDLRQRMMPNNQATGYAYGAARALGIPVTGVLFNGACTYRPLVNPGYKYRGKDPEGPPPLFLREFVPVEEWRMDEWLMSTVRNVKRMVADIEDGVFGNNAPNSCTLFNKRCQFANVCNAAPGLDRDRAKMLDYEVDTYEGFSIEYKE